MQKIKENGTGILLCLLIAIPSLLLGRLFPIIGGPVIAILAGMLLTQFLKNKAPFQPGITYTSKKILQYAVILLGFGLNLSVILKTGSQSLPIILSTISTSLILAFALHKAMHIPAKISALVGVGSSICGGSAIAAAAPVIEADDEEVAQAISVIFFFNVLAALIFPHLGTLIGFSQTSGEAFGIFAGTAVNDTSSVTAAASTWDSLYGLGSATLDKAVTVKLTRTLAIIPICLALAFVRTKRQRRAGAAQAIAVTGSTKTIENTGATENAGAAENAGTAENAGAAENRVSLKQIFPFFILFFLLASVITTAACALGVPAAFFSPFKSLSKFFIIMAMAAIGLNTNIVKLVKTGGKPIFMGLCCFLGITGVSLLLQRLLGIW